MNIDGNFVSRMARFTYWRFVARILMRNASMEFPTAIGREKLSLGIRRRPLGAFAFLLLVISVGSMDIPISQAADVRVVNSRNCYALLSGTIEKGDAAKVEAAFSSEAAQKILWDRNSNVRNALCLDSPGGSYGEAVRIMKFLIGQWPEPDGFRTIGTVVDKGMRCEYACAIAFLGGSTNPAEMNFMEDRVLHENGVLSFGLPPLHSGTGDASRSDLEGAYNESVEAISDLLSVHLTNATPTFIPYDFISGILARTVGDRLRIVPGKELESIRITYLRDNGSCKAYPCGFVQGCKYKEWAKCFEQQ